MQEESIYAKKIKRPSFFWLLTEGGRALTEFGASYPYRSFFKPKANGDGHPVLVLPGFMATDISTAPLRKFINSLGYKAYAWELGRNYAKVRSIELMIEKVDALFQEYGEEVTLIGWSLGGVYARQIAKEKPEYIRQVITLGSPFLGVSQPNNVAWIYNLINRGKKTSDITPDLLADIPFPAPVPTTAIYSKEDGVVPWELCKEIEETAIHQNIQVRGSHLGLGVNASVLNIISDRLQYEKANWVHFKAKNKVKDLLFYPSL